VDFETTGLQKQSKLDLIVSDINSQGIYITFYNELYCLFVWLIV